MKFQFVFCLPSDKCTVLGFPVKVMFKKHKMIMNSAHTFNPTFKEVQKLLWLGI